MEENKELQALLKKLEESNWKQARYAKLQCVFSAAAAVCCIAVLVLVLSLLPQVQGVVDQVDAVLTNVEQVSDQLAQADIAGVMEDLEAVTRQMAQADLAGIADDISALVQSSQSGLEESLGKLNAIDLDSLNKAIKDLSAVVGPLAKLFGR